jgi:hypothetical protein
MVTSAIFSTKKKEGRRRGTSIVSVGSFTCHRHAAKIVLILKEAQLD